VPKTERYICYDAFKVISRLHHCLFTTHRFTREDFLSTRTNLFFSKTKNACMLLKYQAFFLSAYTMFVPAQHSPLP